LSAVPRRRNTVPTSRFEILQIEVKKEGNYTSILLKQIASLETDLNLEK